MKLKRTLALPLLLSAVAAISACSTGHAFADEPGRHPAYLHALSDLRAANWMLEHRRPEDGAIADDELIAHDEIGAAFNEIKRAAIYDGKDLRDRPPIDTALPRDGRLHKAVDLLRKVHSDLAREEDDPDTRGLQHRALAHVDAALHATEQAIGEVHRHERMNE